TKANPIATSAAAMARIKRKTICPSACCHRAPATTNASPAAFSITSSDMSTRIRLRRTRRPVTPSEKRIPAKSSPSLMEISSMLILHSLRSTNSQVVGAHQACEQQHRRQLHTDEVRPEQYNANLFGCHDPRFELRAAASHNQVRHFAKQDAC